MDDEPLEGDRLRDFAEVLQEKLPGELTWDVIYQSIQHLAGQELTPYILDATVWRLVGNLPTLAKFQPVYPWTAQEFDEWVPFQVLSVEKDVTAKGQPAGRFRLQALAGTCCPMILTKFWTLRFCHVLARRMGFTKARLAYPFRSMFEFVNMRFHGAVTVELSGNAPAFEEVHVAPAMEAWNRKILQVRARTNPKVFACPYGYDISLPCHLCHVGLDHCPAAVHDLTYLQMECEQCGETDAWFDPAHPEWKECVDCHHRLLHKRRMEG